MNQVGSRLPKLIPTFSIGLFQGSSHGPAGLYNGVHLGAGQFVQNAWRYGPTVAVLLD